MLEQARFYLRLAFRNLFRNRRRTLGTLYAVGLSCAGLMLFLGYFANIFAGSELQVVNTEGHVQIHRRGFFEQGAGNPAAYAIDDYRAIASRLEREPFLRDVSELMSARLLFTGLAIHHATGDSAPFLGVGVLPRDEERVSRWNPYGMTTAYDLEINRELFDTTPEIDDADPQGGSLGVGLARILGIESADSAGADLAPGPNTEETEEDGDIDPASSELDFDFLESLGTVETSETGRPAIDLMVLPAEGAMPNVETLYVRRVLNRATRELDDRLLKLHLDHASGLLFPGERPKATAIVLLLRRSRDAEEVTRYLESLFRREGLELEAFTWQQIQPFHRKLVGVFRIMMIFVALIIAGLVIFAIYNTVSSGISERTTEIGTLRAMGTSKKVLHRLLLAESLLLGLLGGLLGVILGILSAWLVNSLDFLYPLPASSYYAKLEVFVLREPTVIVWGFLTATMTALISGLLAARRAARLSIVEALRHT